MFHEFLAKSLETYYPYLGHLIGLASLIFTVLVFMVGRTRFFRGSYETHIKNLVNDVYNKVTNNGKNLADSDFFGTVADSKEILEHFFIHQKKSNLHGIFSEIVENRRGARDRILELRKQFSEEFLKLHGKINRGVDPDFGFCSECVGKKAKIPFFAKRKLNLKT